MKRGVKLGIFLAAAVVLAGVLVSMLRGEKPLKGLESQEILAARVALYPPDVTLELEEWEELAGYLREIVTYQADQSYVEYAGQSVEFQLLLADGSSRSVVVFFPFVILDSVGYRAEAQPCRDLEAYANRLFQEGDLTVVLEKPPALDIVSGNTVMAAEIGEYSWQRREMDGSETSLQGEGKAPLEYRAQLAPMDTQEGTAFLRFAQEPEEVVCVQYWDGELGALSSVPTGQLTARGLEIPLLPGRVLYQVQARWEGEKGFGGRASYWFSVEYGE